MNTTKTHVVPEEGDIYNIEWDSNEHMRVIVYNSSTCNKLETTNFTLNDNGTGTFEAEIPSGEWTNISGIYPLSATDGTRSEDKQTDYRISLPQVQIPSRDSYDPKAFIMIARNTEVPEDLNNYVWNAYYYRATALNNFTIKNLEHADNIVNVKITFPEDELVAGYKRVDLTTCTVTGNRYQNSPNYIELKYTEPLSADASGNYELWFTTWEINVEPDETVKVDNEYGLDENEMFFLTALLMQQPWQTYLKQHHLMASILMDNINEKLFDEFGDVVLENNEQDQPQVITDYVDDLKDMFLKG